MRMAIAVAFFSAASFLAVGLASAVPLALGDQAALARYASAGAVEPAALHALQALCREILAPLQLDLLSLLAALSVPVLVVYYPIAGRVLRRRPIRG